MIEMFGSYDDWRATVPFTNAQISAAIRLASTRMPNEYMSNRYVNMADYIDRTGRLSSKHLSIALPELVKECDICGKTALYRLGSRGRCSKHRDVPDVFVEARKARAAFKSASWEWREEARNRIMDASSRHYSSVGKKKRGLK